MSDPNSNSAEPSTWYDALARCARAGEAHVLATVLATSGSAPRPQGSKMVVTASASHDSIGGGQLEWLVINQCRALLREGGTARVQHFPLAAAANQCCGGAVTVLLEPFAANQLHVSLFGAGHIGLRVAALLHDLPVTLRWFDSRTASEPASNQRPELLADVTGQVTDLPLHTRALVMTHDHTLDYDLVLALLRRGCTSVGLIGSATKAERFRARLASAGLTTEDCAALRCPIGLDAIRSKQPTAIAVSVVAELLAQHNHPEAPSNGNDLTWRQIRQSLVQDG